MVVVPQCIAGACRTTFQTSDCLHRPTTSTLHRTIYGRTSTNSHLENRQQLCDRQLPFETPYIIIVMQLVQTFKSIYDSLPSALPTVQKYSYKGQLAPQCVGRIDPILNGTRSNLVYVCRVVGYLKLYKTRSEGQLISYMQYMDTVVDHMGIIITRNWQPATYVDDCLIQYYLAKHSYELLTNQLVRYSCRLQLRRHTMASYNYVPGLLSEYSYKGTLNNRLAK